MFFWKKAEAEDISGFLDRGTEFTGELRFSGTLRIDGVFHGTIATADMLIVGEHASIHGEIRAGEIEIHGRVTGNVESLRRIEIFPTGRVRADIRTTNLLTHSGGVIDGRIQMADTTEGSTPADIGNTIMRSERDETH